MDLKSLMQTPAPTDFCDVCRDGEVQDGNEILFCDGCDCAVHQLCFGLRGDVPSGDWFCKVCERKRQTGKEAPLCALCLHGGGVLKKTTDDGDMWCHLSCARWVPETYIVDPVEMEPIAGLANVSVAVPD